MLIALLLVVSVTEGHSIVDFGAVPNNESYAAAVQNGYALFQAAQAAHQSPLTGDRTVVIPVGEWSMLPYTEPLDGLFKVTFDLQGTIAAFRGEIKLWPNHNGGGCIPVFAVYRSSQITLTSSTQNGTVNGYGLRWWWGAIVSHLPHSRPNLIHMESCIDTVFEYWRLVDSPHYHVKWVDMLNGLIQHVTVFVSVDDQKSLLRSNGHLTAEGIPTFPLNTDGIDVRGHNITVRRCHVENFDDSLCVKPMNGGGNLTQCSTDIVLLLACF
jgi:hypothetical protein